MALQTTTEMYRKAYDGGYAIGGFIAYNMEMMQALIRAHNRAKAPLLLQSSAQAVDYAGFGYLTALARAVADEAEVPVAHHLDHGYTVEVCKAAVDAGFTSVMFDGSALPFEENVRLTREVVEHAHARGAVVEGEIGSPELGGVYTDPGQAAEYVERTGIDALAVAIGNSHGQMKSDRPAVIDLGLAGRIRDAVPGVPLVLHALTVVPQSAQELFRNSGGALGTVNVVPEEVYIATARTRGIAKLNIGSSLKLTMVGAIRDYNNRHPANSDPRKPLAFARDQLEALIVANLDRLGSAGKA